jgi:hypothetical protein
MDVGTAFTYIFDDKSWVKKVAIGGLGAFLTIIIIPIFAIQGYMLQTLKNVRDEVDTPLPEWNNLGDFLIKGVMVSLIWLVYHLPAIILYCPLIALSFSSGQVDPDIQQAARWTTSGLYCIQFVLFLVSAFLFPAGLIRYAEKDALSAAFQLGEVLNFIKNNSGDYIIVVVLAFLTTFLASFGLIFCIVGVFLTYFLTILVKANLYGQLARKAMLSIEV